MHISLQQNASQIASKHFQRSDGTAEGPPQVCRTVTKHDRLPNSVLVTTRPAQLFLPKRGMWDLLLDVKVQTAKSLPGHCNISAKHIQVTTWDIVQFIKDISGAVTQVTISRGICGLPTEMRIYH